MQYEPTSPRPRRFLRTIAVFTLLGGACGVEDIATMTQAATQNNGVSPNGVSPNGVSPNGVALDGTTLVAVKFAGASLAGVVVQSLSVASGQFTASVGGVARNSLTSSGMLLSGRLDNGATLPLRLDNAIAGTGALAGFTLHNFSYQNTTGWVPLCGTSGGVPIAAFVFGGVWNPGVGVKDGGKWNSSDTEFSIGCRGAALAKCAELGYTPWTGLRDPHLTCVRLLRADYCGNGTAYTTNGRLINLYDVYGIQLDTMNWTHEATWNKDGATCLTNSKLRYLATAPACASDLVKAQCSLPTDPNSSTLTASEFQGW